MLSIRSSCCGAGAVSVGCGVVEGSNAKKKSVGLEDYISVTLSQE